VVLRRPRLRPDVSLWVVAVIGTSANLTVERVGFEGDPGTMPPNSKNYDNGPCYFGLGVDAPITGTFKVVSSRIKNGGIVCWPGTSGTVKSSLAVLLWEMLSTRAR